MSNYKALGHQLGIKQVEQQAVQQALETYFPRPDTLRSSGQQPQQQQTIQQVIKNGRIQILKVNKDG